MLDNNTIYMFSLSGIQAYDIISTLQYLGMIKYWRGKHVILRKEDVIADYMERTRGRPKDKVNNNRHHQPLYSTTPTFTAKL